MAEKRIVETMESLFEWLSQSDATSLEEDEDFAKAIEIVKQAVAKRDPADIEAPESAKAESQHGAHDPKLNKALVRRQAPI